MTQNKPVKYKQDKGAVSLFRKQLLSEEREDSLLYSEVQIAFPFEMDNIITLTEAQKQAYSATTGNLPSAWIVMSLL